ncbi:hypothetical protein GLA29479_4853 [Lysobacter antibioticus]|uniref:Uncharacterized protein n=1 Tax=Lysobacter antibioticus TaxID=84531 RepID=A0A0S2E4K1_LYSAN|nr:hypothetical protein GLA29479_4853 [Lysobacter antibioticus]ALN81447.1 hypothetical protein LA76x_3321 [Lysobacter antibioticus]
MRSGASAHPCRSRRSLSSRPVAIARASRQGKGEHRRHRPRNRLGCLHASFLPNASDAKTHRLARLRSADVFESSSARLRAPRSCEAKPVGYGVGGDAVRNDGPCAAVASMVLIDTSIAVRISQRRAASAARNYQHESRANVISIVDWAFVSQRSIGADSIVVRIAIRASISRARSRCMDGITNVTR